MGKQIGFHFDGADDELLTSLLDTSEPWSAFGVDERRWKKTDELPEGKLFLAPQRLVPQLNNMDEPSERAGRVLEWSRQPGSARSMLVGGGRIWLDTSGAVDPEVGRRYTSLVRFITTTSPSIVSDVDRPLYIGPSLTEKIEDGSVIALWQNGERAQLKVNRRHKNPASKKTSRRKS